MKYFNYIQLVEDVMNGEESPFKALSEINQLEKDVKLAKEAILEAALDEAGKYPNNFEIDGLEITKRSGATRYDFKEIQEWLDKKAELIDIEARAKAAHKAFSVNLQPVTQDGEVLTLPKVTKSRDSLIIKVKKGQEI